jgi:N-acetylglucosaminyldiphosphoundecaprenol N-acetyl-beta-D-mannosaminyltransferase
MIVTPNPEIVLRAQNDPKLALILNSADISLPDGVGLIFAANLLNRQSLTLIKGRQMFLDLVKLAVKEKWKIFLLGGGKGVAEKAKDNIYKCYEQSLAKSEFGNGYIQTSPGPKLDREGNPVTEVDKKSEKDLVDKINKFAPQILFVGFGCPKQEKWLAKNLSKLKIGGAMVVGGTFDLISGKRPLPPKWLEILGLEWLFRLLTKPGHFGRAIDATIVFPWRVLTAKFFAGGRTREGKT